MSNKEGFLKLSEAPFLKYLLSFVIGIIIQMIFGRGYYIALPFLLLSSVLFYYHYTASLSKIKFIRRKYFGYAIFSLFIALGAIDGELWTKSKTEIPHITGYAIAQISDDISIKEHSVECKCIVLKLNGVEKTSDDLNVILYISPDSLSRNLNSGDILIFEPNLQPIKLPKNPFSDNYASRLESEGFFYSQYLTSNNWEKIDRIESNRFFDKAAEIKSRLSKYIEGLNINNKSKLLIKAMVLGDITDLTTDVRSVYSASGLSHILAVSGLHVGIIALIIYMLFYPFKWIKLQQIKPLITILILWIYLYIIGLPPSAVRATIMATFVLFGEVINRKGTTLNSLFAAALFMLVYNPQYINSISFQLSFTAVFSIFFIYPYIYQFLPNKNRVTSYISSIVAVTLAAQIGTLPLVIYYFHQIPLIGLLTNLLVIPILPFVIGISIAVIVLPIEFIENITDFSFKYIDAVAQFSASIPYSSINNIHMKSYYILFAYILIAVGLWALKCKRKDLVISLLIFIALFIITENFFINKDNKNFKAVIYDDNHITAINFIDENYNYVLTVDTAGVDKKVGYMARNLWIKEAIGDAVFITDSITDNGLYLYLPYIGYKGEKYLILNSDEFKYKELSNGGRLYIDKAVICNNFSGSIAKLTEMFIFNEVVITSNLNHFKRNSIIKECKTLKIPYYDIKENGAYIVYE